MKLLKLISVTGAFALGAFFASPLLTTAQMPENPTTCEHEGREYQEDDRACIEGFTHLCTAGEWEATEEKCKR